MSCAFSSFQSLKMKQSWCYIISKLILYTRLGISSNGEILVIHFNEKESSKRNELVPFFLPPGPAASDFL